jgi:hypothetical protein
MSGIGQLFALLALDEADRAERLADARRRPDEGLDPARSETRAAAWGRWTADREADPGATVAEANKPATAMPRRAAHI